jgi:hypothetical protein
MLEAINSRIAADGRTPTSTLMAIARLEVLESIAEHIERALRRLRGDLERERRENNDE